MSLGYLGCDLERSGEVRKVGKPVWCCVILVEAGIGWGKMVEVEFGKGFVSWGRNWDMSGKLG